MVNLNSRKKKKKKKEILNNKKKNKNSTILPMVATFYWLKGLLKEIY